MLRKARGNWPFLKSPCPDFGCLSTHTDLQNSALGQSISGKKQPLPSLRLFQNKQTTFLLPKREMSRHGSAPKPALPQHLPSFYSKNPKIPLQIRVRPQGPKSFTKTALVGKRVAGGDHLVWPQVRGLRRRRCFGAPLLREHHSRGVGDPKPTPLVSNPLGFLGLWAKRQNTPPSWGRGCSVR